MKNLIVYHSADCDGWMSGYLLTLEYPNSKTVGFNYENTSNETDRNYENPKGAFIDELKQACYDNIIFGDCCPSLKELKYMLDTYRELYIIIYDHHFARNNTVREFIKNNKDYSARISIANMHYDYESGCQLIFNLMSKDNIPYTRENILKFLCKIISLYDTWGFKHFTKDQIRDFAYTNFSFSDITYLDDDGRYLNQLNELIDKDYIEQFMMYINSRYTNFEEFKDFLKECFKDVHQIGNGYINGGLISELKKKEIKRALNSADINVITFPNIKDFSIYFVVFNFQIYPFTEDVLREKIKENFGIEDPINLLFISYKLNQATREIIFSVRSSFKTILSSKYDEIYDSYCALAIAEMYGGGGHANAAGFKLNFQEGFEFLESSNLLSNITSNIETLQFS